MAAQNSLRPGYHDILRPEILNLVPLDAKKIIDLGCGTGELGHALKLRQPCNVSGVELNNAAYEIAKKRLDSVYNDNLNRYDPLLSQHNYDCIIMADILEHLVAPWQVLSKFVNVLSSTGRVIASIPNIAHPSIITDLQKGRWRYAPAGILDITHLRFFTRVEIYQMFTRAGLKILSCAPWPAEKNPIQYLITATKPQLKYRTPITTILLLTHNNIRYTRECIDSIRANTTTPHVILVIDNGSSDGTLDMLRRDLSLLHIETNTNHGFSHGFNIGLECVNTPFFVIANNDIIVTSGWLDRLIKHINLDDKLMILGTRSNYVSGPQCVQNPAYTTQTELAQFADTFKNNEEKPITYWPRIVFFCTLFRTEALKKIGYLDEMYGIGNYEDDDYCMRTRIQHYNTAYDNTVFIHHYGSKTFLQNNIDYDLLLRTNKQKYLNKFGLKEG